MKTYIEWEEAEIDLDEFLKVDDEIDYEIFEHIGYCLCHSNYDDGHFLQSGEPDYEKDGVDYFMTAEEIDGKYFYRGILRDMNKPIRRSPVNNTTARPLQVGDPVEVFDEGLLMLQRFAPKNARPNNHGTVLEIWDEGKTILISFPIGDDDPEEHSQAAPYPINKVKLRK